MTEEEYRSMHMGRSWSSHPIEDACPCPKAPCGLVTDWAEECDQHNPMYSRTMRQVHSAVNCPGAVIS